MTLEKNFVIYTFDCEIAQYALVTTEMPEHFPPCQTRRQSSRIQSRFPCDRQLASRPDEPPIEAKGHRHSIIEWSQRPRFA